MAAAFRFSAAAQETVDGNLVRMTTSADFSAAQLTNLTVDETIGGGAILACCTPPARTTAANHAFLYDFSVKEEGILIDPTRRRRTRRNRQNPRLSRKKRSLPSPTEKKAGFLWLWILLGVIIVGGAAAVLMALTKRKKK